MVTMVVGVVHGKAVEAVVGVSLVSKVMDASGGADDGNASCSGSTGEMALPVVMLVAVATSKMITEIFYQTWYAVSQIGYLAKFCLLSLYKESPYIFLQMGTIFYFVN